MLPRAPNVIAPPPAASIRPEATGAGIAIATKIGELERPALRPPRSGSPELSRVPQATTKELSNQKSADRREIADLLKNFEQAIESRNLRQLQVAWPGMPRPVLDSFKRAFRDSRVRYSVHLKPLSDVETGPDSATLDCERTARTVAGEIEKPDQVTHVRVFLERRTDGWGIRGIEDLH